MKVDRVNYNDFITQIDKLRDIVKLKFHSLTVDDLKQLYKEVEYTLDEWDFLSNDIEAIYTFLENMEDEEC